jgi:hypothetical protein
MLRLATDADVHGDVIRGLGRREPRLNVVRVQDVGLRTADDAAILEWTASQGRILITGDRKTLVGTAYERVKAGLPMSGVMVFRHRLSIGQAIEEILIVALCSTEDEMKDRVVFLPL